MTDDEIKKRLDHNLAEMIAQYNRPYRLVCAQFERYGTGWRLTHHGLEAVGETPAIAAENFDHLWTFGGEK